MRCEVGEGRYKGENILFTGLGSSVIEELKYYPGEWVSEGMPEPREGRTYLPTGSLSAVMSKKTRGLTIVDGRRGVLLDARRGGERWLVRGGPRGSHARSGVPCAGVRGEMGSGRVGGPWASRGRRDSRGSGSSASASVSSRRGPRPRPEQIQTRLV